MVDLGLDHVELSTETKENCLKLAQKNLKLYVPQEGALYLFIFGTCYTGSDPGSEIRDPDPGVIRKFLGQRSGSGMDPLPENSGSAALQ